VQGWGDRNQPYRLMIIDGLGKKFNFQHGIGVAWKLLHSATDSIQADQKLLSL